MADRTEYKCAKCDKVYASYKSRWLHLKKYHNPDVVENVVVIPHAVVENVVEKHNSTVADNLSNLHCKNCLKKFCDRIYRWRHEQKCKLKTESLSKIDTLEKENTEIKQEIIELKTILKKIKLSPKSVKSLKTVNNNNNTNTNTINSNNNINNNNINTNINIIHPGRENLNEIMSKDEQIAVLNKMAHCMQELVQRVHINNNNKYKSCKNIYISNLQNNIGYRYDEKFKKFIAVPKKDLLERLIEDRLYDIALFYENYQDQLTVLTSSQVDRFIKNMNGEESKYKKDRRKELLFVLFNGRKKIIDQIKEQTPELKDIFV